MSTPTHDVGSRVASLRRQRQLSQKELAAELGRSESWMSQVERGVQPVERLSVLRDIANALGVTIQELRPEVAPEPTVANDEETAVNDLDAVRLCLSGHPALHRLLAQADLAEPVDLSVLGADVAQAWDAAHASRFARLSELLTDLLPRLEHAARSIEGVDADRREVHRLRASAYQAAAAAFARQDEPDAAWVAADRAITAAELAGQPLDVVAGHFRLAHAFMRLRRRDQAEQVATTAIVALSGKVGAVDAPVEVLSLYGALHLVQANISAAEHDRAKAHQHLASAEDAARRIGEDRNDFETEFGPTNVQVHAVGVAVDLGDAGEALDIATNVDPSPLSAERRARFHIDVARAATQRRQVGDAVASLIAAESITPEYVRSHRLVRATTNELVMFAAHRASEDLRSLAQRLEIAT